MEPYAASYRRPMQDFHAPSKALPELVLNTQPNHLFQGLKRPPSLEAFQSCNAARQYEEFFHKLPDLRAIVFFEPQMGKVFRQK